MRARSVLPGRNPMTPRAEGNQLWDGAGLSAECDAGGRQGSNSRGPRSYTGCRHSHYIIVFLQIMATFLTYISNASHSCSGVAMRFQQTQPILASLVKVKEVRCVALCQHAAVSSRCAGGQPGRTQGRKEASASVAGGPAEAPAEERHNMPHLTEGNHQVARHRLGQHQALRRLRLDACTPGATFLSILFFFDLSFCHSFKENSHPDRLLQAVSVRT